MKALTIDGLAERWQVNPRTIRRLIEAGELKAFRVGAAWRISEEAVNQFEGGNNA